MDWTLAITRNRDALKPIIAALCELAGLKPGRVHFSAARKYKLSPALTLPRHIFAAVLLVLRPAESAVRRLIVIMARLIEATRRTSALPLIRSFGPPSPRKQRGEGYARDVLWNESDSLGTLPYEENTSKSMRLSPSPRYLRGPKAGETRGSPRSGGQRPDEGQRQNPAIVIKPGDGFRSPKAPAFALFDPLKTFDPDAIWNLDEANESGFRSGENPDHSTVWRVLPDANEPLPAEHILRRLAAIRRALDTRPYQARRLLRFNARRDAQLSKPFKGPIRLSPMRPGLPPGWRQLSIHEVDPILKECHLLANDLLCDTG